MDADIPQSVPDYIPDKPRILLIGINPGIGTSKAQWHFTGPGNRFWPTLVQAGILKKVPEIQDPSELYEKGYGITNIVSRTTRGAADVSREEYIEGGKILKEKIMNLQPKAIIFFGLGAYRIAFDDPKASFGQQDNWDDIKVYLLHNPSGLNAHYKIDEMAQILKEIDQSV